MDDLDQDLASLAPRVDAVAARRAFDGQRTSARRLRRITTGLVGLLAIVGLVGGVAALTQDAADELEVGSEGLPPPVRFEVLDEIDPREGLSRLVLIADHDQLAMLTDAPASANVDFEEQYVVALTAPDDICTQLLRIDRQGDDLVPVIEVPDVVACSADAAVERTFVVAIDRSGGGGRMQLPADDTLGLSEASLQLPSPIDFELVAMQEASEPMGTLRAASDAAGYEELWTETGMTGEPPDIDLDQRLVVSMTIPDDACPPTLAGFARSGGAGEVVLRPVFAEPLGSCDEPLVPKTFVATIERAVLDGPGEEHCCVTFRLWATEPFNEEVSLTLEVGVDEDPGVDPNGSVVPPPTDGEITFDVLGRREARGGSMDRVQSATTEEAYLSLWRAAGFDGSPPDVDFDEQVVVGVIIPDDACPPELAHFERDGDTIIPVFVEPEGGCILPLISKTYVVALDRGPLEPGFRLLLPGQEPYGFGDTSTVVRFAGPAPAPSCATIDAFADVLGTTGMDADTSASQSPSDLLGPGTVAFRGVLTGGFASAGERESDVRYVAFEVEVTQRLYEVGRRFGEPGRELVSFPVAVDVDRLADVAAASAGTPVVVISQMASGVPFSLLVGHEGLATECEGGPLLGRVGTEGEWADIDSLDELADAISGP